MKNLSPQTKKLYQLAACGMLIAISVIFQVFHIGYPTQWGMWIDVVAIPWLIIYFLFGFRMAFITSLISSFVIALVAPSGFLGAFMKFTATFPMFALPALISLRSQEKMDIFRKFGWLLLALVTAIIARAILVIPLNYYFAIPIWTGMTAKQAMTFIPPLIIFGLNALQGTLETLVAWLIVYKFNLKRFR